jgi:hypothetical protein
VSIFDCPFSAGCGILIKNKRGGDRMHPQFAELTPRWFKRAFVYTGSIGDFRYRFDMGKEKGILHTAVYSVYCYEVAQDRQERDFPWDEAGVEELKQWLQAKYDQFSAGKGLAD